MGLPLGVVSMYVPYLASSPAGAQACGSGTAFAASSSADSGVCSWAAFSRPASSAPAAGEAPELAPAMAASLQGPRGETR